MVWDILPFLVSRLYLHFLQQYVVHSVAEPPKALTVHVITHSRLSQWGAAEGVKRSRAG